MMSFSKLTLLMGVALAVFMTLLIFGGQAQFVKFLLFAVVVVAAFIAFGVITPSWYSKPSRLPKEIKWNDKNCFVFDAEGERLFTVPTTAIKSLEYRSEPGKYGIAIFLKSKPLKPIVINDPTFNLAEYHRYCQREYRCDILFPFFDYDSFVELQASVNRGAKGTAGT